MKLKFSCPLFLLIGSILLFPLGTAQAWAGTAATTTTLTVTSGGKTVTTLTSGSAVTLTAAVVSGSTKVTVGQVNFCDASALSCTDIHLLGTAQLTSAGTAALSLGPAIGSHSYAAVFAGTPNGATPYAGSTSASMSLTVTGTWPTTTTISQSGNAGVYTLGANVYSNAPTAPTGTVSFLNAGDGNAVLGSAALHSGTAGLNFLAASPPVGTLPLEAENSGPVAVSDFNGDGFLDIAVTYPRGCNGVGDCFDAGLVMLLGNGDGSFKELAPLDLGSDEIAAVAVGDFNGDGIPDLALESLAQEQEVTILLGNGDGTFSVKGNVPTGGNSQSLVAADFNGDGIADLAVLNTTADIVTVLLGKGDGTFTPSTAATSPTGSDPTGMAVGDFNGDGIADLAIANNINPAGALTILLGNGDGTFTAAASPGTGADPTSIAVADFNGDGNQDLAVANGDRTVTILLGNGEGAFTEATGSPVVLSQTGPPNFIETGDFNGDGKVDLGVAESLDFSGSSVVLLGNGDGSFASTPVSAVEGIFAVGDFNDDGSTDLVLEDESEYNGVGVSLAVDQTATASASGIVAPPATSTLAVASYIGDARNAASVSVPIYLTGAQATPQVVVQAAPNPAPLGTSVTLTATVTGGGDTPTGTVTFYDGSLLLGSGALNGSGVAAYSSSSIPQGANSIMALYGGDSNYFQTNSSAVVLTVTAALATPTVTVTPSATSITAAQSLTVPVAVSGSTGSAIPTGTVTLASGSYTAQQTLAGGAASFTISPGALNSGSDTLTATYSGDGNYAAAMGTATVTVSQAGMSIPAPASVTPGRSASATVTITASDNYTGTLNLTCALTASPTGAQSLPTCSLNPASVTLKAGASGTSTLTVATTAASTSAQLDPSLKNLWGLGSGRAVLAVLLMGGIPARRRRWMSMLALAGIVVASLVAGCGGGGRAPTGTSATTAGKYVFTVTGTDSSNAAITISATVTVTVQ